MRSGRTLSDSLVNKRFLPAGPSGRRAGPSLVASLALLVMSGCQNGNKGVSPSTPAPEQHANDAVILADGVWLGRRAIPVAAPPADHGPPPTDFAHLTARHWEVKAGESVASAIRRWSEAAGYTPLPVFSATENWNFIVSQDFTGSFEQALVWLSDGFQRQPIKPVAVLFANRTLDLVGEPTAATRREAQKEPADRGTMGEGP